MTIAKLTFKNCEKPTGLSAVGSHYAHTDIKVNGKVVGYIAPPAWNTVHRGFVIRLMVISESEHCGWKWIQLKKQCETNKETRSFFKENFARIAEKYTLRLSED